MVKQVDTRDLKSLGSNAMPVRPRPRAPWNITPQKIKFHNVVKIRVCGLCSHPMKRIITLIAKIKCLKGLVLEDTPKISDLSPLSQCIKLESFEFSGGMWKSNKTESLEPISGLPKLSSLRLLNLSVSSGLKSLASLTSLRELELSNQFPTEEYAYLSVKLDGVHCEYFAP